MPHDIIASICGGMGDIFIRDGTDLEGIENVVNIPIWVFHGTKDDTVHLAESVMAMEN